MLREKKGLTMNALSMQIFNETNIKVSSGQISDWENGNKKPSADGIIALSTFFEVTADWILTGEDRATPKITQQESAIFFENNWDVVSQFTSLTEEELVEVKNFIEFLRFKKEGNKNTVCQIESSSRSTVKTYFEIENNEDELHPVPLVGKTAAGIEKTFYEFIHGYMPVPKIYAKGTCFVMEVEGDSMTGDGIENGDFVVIRQQPTVESNEIALLRINNEEMTLKRIYNEGDRTVLISSNHIYTERSVPADSVRVVGKFIYLIPKEIGNQIIREELF